MWRCMQCLLVYVVQVNNIAPHRKKDSDGLIGDPAHKTGGHVPHAVPGVGAEIVTACDITHDPAGGMDSYRLAEALRVSRDPRISYVISNHRIFSGHVVDGVPAWTWRPYTATDDPHTNHCHLSTVENATADTGAPFDLSFYTSGAPMPDTGFNATDRARLYALADRQHAFNILDPIVEQDLQGHPYALPVVDLLTSIDAQCKANGATLSRILALLTPGTVTMPVSAASGSFTGGTVTFTTGT